MLSRRRLLSGSATAAIATLAGCSGFLTEDDSSDDSSTNTESAGDGASTDNQNGLSDQGKQHVLGTYEDAIGDVNAGEESLEAGMSWYDDDRYGKALEEYEDARDSFQFAVGKFQTAIDIGSDDVGDDVLASIRDAKEYAEYRLKESRATEEALDLEIVSGSAEEIETYRDNAEKARRNAESIDLKTVAELRTAMESA